ncbi:uncharacterized membrane protein (DUF485 family) [Fluviicoccus keumensis]|uniref:Uncharacterized membrane protein (DUF485 family) n=1 Tax=Fluviicoccus keumensis TaxID=1435465 RepID=A0A4Q7ZDF1_9GAMM|nr:DUF485 domain-containing protein [Fluviicoccus keumensis]RZU48093.1 uncharacterized membrane protein (DUF485 family) [Fluviicoccus keumensis]
MKPDQIQDILDHPHFKELVHKKRVLSWSLAALMWVIYFGYILLVTFEPKLLHESLSGGVTTIGIPLGIFVILSAFILCGIYVWRANGELDALNKLLRDEVKL